MSIGAIEAFEICIGVEFFILFLSRVDSKRYLIIESQSRGILSTYTYTVYQIITIRQSQISHVMAAPITLLHIQRHRSYIKYMPTSVRAENRYSQKDFKALTLFYRNSFQQGSTCTDGGIMVLFCLQFVFNKEIDLLLKST